MNWMQWLLAAYLLGVVVRTALLHGALQNDKFRGDLDWQMASILGWPLFLPYLMCKTSR